MTPTEELCAMLDELGIEHRSYWYENYVWWDGKDGVCWHAEDSPHINGSHVSVGAVITPEQAVATTVGRRYTMELWPEWEQVLFANVSDEVAQDNLNECVHELLDKAATVGEECEMHICKRCGVAYELNIIDKGFGKPRFCPNCGGRRIG